MAKSSDIALVATGLTVGIVGYDHLRSGSASSVNSVQTYVSLGLGSVLLIALAETVPELGVPLSVLLLMVVAIARPTGVNFIARLLNPQPSTSNQAGSNAQGTQIIAPNTGG